MRSPKALIVDNDFFFVEFLSDLLAKRGYGVLKAYNGKEGIAKLEEGPVAILFADLVMPKVDGKQLFHFIREKYDGDRFPLVAVSGTMIEHLAFLDEIGADYFIAKGPIDPLTATLNEFLREFETHPFIPPTDKKVVAHGKVFPRRDAVTLLGALQFHQAVIESAGVGLIIVDSDARILSANARALEITGKRAVDVVNTPVCDIFHARDRFRIAAGLKQVVHPAESKAHVSLHAAFGTQTIGTIISPIRQQGQAIGWVITLEPPAKIQP
jgi:PAS domain S-box-containing protein